MTNGAPIGAHPQEGRRIAPDRLTGNTLRAELNQLSNTAMKYRIIKLERGRIYPICP